MLRLKKKTNKQSHILKVTTLAILGAHKKSMLEYEQGPLMEYTPYTHHTGKILRSLADLKPKTLATMHGSSFVGNCSQALLDLNIVMKEIYDAQENA